MTSSVTRSITYATGLPAHGNLHAIWAKGIATNNSQQTQDDKLIHQFKIVFDLPDFTK